MISSNRHIGRTKAITLALILFYGIATGRSLLPGLCSTLSALDRDQTILESTDPCCAIAYQESDQPELHAPSKAYATCALCSLVQAHSQPITYVALESSALNPESPVAIDHAAPALQDVWSPAALRAPPINA